MIRAGLLTPFQVNHLLQGRCTELVLGPYRLLDRIGEGGMGQVFKARHERLGRIVALKVIRKDKLADPLALDRFRRETRTAAQLDHPNIVRALDADAIGPCHLLVMEFVDGVDLSQLVKRNGPLPIRAACDFICQAALGLQHAHEKGIIHRDIKPSNILVSKTSGSQSRAPGQEQRAWGLVKILDMGLARLLDPSEEDAAAVTMTQTGSVVGTPDFIAPEQAHSSRQTDARSDMLQPRLHFLLPVDGPGAVSDRHGDREVAASRHGRTASGGAAATRFAARFGEDCPQAHGQATRRAWGASNSPSMHLDSIFRSKLLPTYR